MCAVSDAGDLAVLLTGFVQALVAVDVDQSQLLHSEQEQGQRVCEEMPTKLFNPHYYTFNLKRLFHGSHN